jgi:hypothetical protein
VAERIGLLLLNLITAMRFLQGVLPFVDALVSYAADTPALLIRIEREVR